jgi:hypothetical protein
MKIGGTSGFNVELLGYYAYNQVKSQGPVTMIAHNDPIPST